MKEIRLNAFVANTPAFPLSPGMWTHENDRSIDHGKPEYWIGMARMLERGLFDGVFIADTTGVNDVYGGTRHASIRNGIQIPRHDPLFVVPYMAQATTDLGFGVTVNLTQESPYLLARKLSTLDHLTGGRIGWNIVTGFLSSGARASGKAKITDHDERYVIADEFMDVVYRLWEDSWEEGAVLRDKVGGVFADPERVHSIEHSGDYFAVSGVHMVDPSPQRTPVLYQAGASSSGRDFAARHAECIFIVAPTKEAAAKLIADIRSRAKAFGRDPADILMFVLACVIVDRSGDVARRRIDEYRKHATLEGSLVMLSGYTGIDLSRYDVDGPFPSLESSAVQSVVAQFTTEDPDRKWTIREVAELNAIGGRGPIMVGTPEEVADEMQAWMEATDADGFNMAHAVYPYDYEAFIDLVVPVLQKRGVYKTSYRPGTLREKLYGAGRSRLPAAHPAKKR